MTRTSVALLALVVLLVGLPGVAAAETRSGGTVVVGANETVEGDLRAYGGSIVVRGTVTGDLQAFGGDVRIAESGTVEGDVETGAGSVEIAGAVGGDVEASGGSVRLTETGRVDGAFQAGAGAIVIRGTIGENATLAAERIRLGPGAAIGGDLTYDGTLDRAEGATVEGAVTRDPSLEVGSDDDGGPAALPGPVVSVYGFLVTLTVGAVLLFAFPRFSTEIADRVAADPVRTGGFGLLVLIAIPVVLVLLLVTVVGIPLSLAGLVLYGLVVWAATVYGRYAVGEWLLSYTDVESRWVALLVGVLAVAVAALIPVLGSIVEFAVLLLGFGALALGLRSRYRSRGGEASRGSEAGPA